MKRHHILLPALLLVLALLLASCSGTANTPTWQEQYDLGVRYLSEGNYEEAIIAFTAAIEIDPKRAPAYVGRADAYIASGETEENLSAARADYENAIDLDETLAEVYIKLADVYIRQEEYEKALNILRRGLEKNESQAIADKLAELDLLREYQAEDTPNAFGGEAFTSRETYVPFNALSAQEQNFIVSAVEATLRNDRTALLALAETGEEIVASRNVPHMRANPYTIWQRYKIGLFDETMGLDKDAYTQNYWTMQIRPENDVGYFISVCSYQANDPDTIESYYVYSHSTIIATCPCQDWQWNGALQSMEIRESSQKDSGGGRDKISTTEITGAMKNSLKDGEFTRIYQSKWNEFNGSTSDHFSTIIEQYADGKCLDSERVYKPDAYYAIDDMSYGSNMMTNVAFLNFLYW